MTAVEVNANLCNPYGDPKRAKVFVIGHDPRLRQGKAEAKYAFFLEYLERPYPSSASERRKYDLACAAIDYIKHLSGAFLSLNDMYFTNLCNEFLERPSGGGIVLIRNEVANRGIEEIDKALSLGAFKVILPMSPQVFYHLVRTGFVSNRDENLRTFLERARPKPEASERGACEPVGKSPFLLVCGRMYHHRNDLTPVIPIIHVKQWPLKAKMQAFCAPMKMAARNVFAILSTDSRRP
ncbi:MAG: hypothetical protein HY669_03320 [Chloroflexi bacterium]|nr:hypothetical protein [Chloroflexota bacterium]